MLFAFIRFPVGLTRSVVSLSAASAYHRPVSAVNASSVRMNPASSSPAASTMVASSSSHLSTRAILALSITIPLLLFTPLLILALLLLQRRRRQRRLLCPISPGEKDSMLHSFVVIRRPPPIYVPLAFGQPPNPRPPSSSSSPSFSSLNSAWRPLPSRSTRLFAVNALPGDISSSSLSLPPSSLSPTPAPSVRAFRSVSTFSDGELLGEGTWEYEDAGSSVALDRISGRAVEIVRDRDPDEGLSIRSSVIQDPFRDDMEEEGEEGLR